MSLPVTLRHLMCVWDVTGCSGAGIQQAEGEMKRQQEVSGRADESIELESPSESHTLTGKHRNRDTDVENKRTDTNGGKCVCVGGGGMNWETGIDIYALICIK